MECDICRRGHEPKRLPFLCAVDARNHLYEGRMKNLQALVENEGLQKQIGDFLDDATGPSQAKKEVIQAQQRMAEDRTTQILAAADKLRNDIKAAREEIQARKTAMSHRKSDIAAVSDGLAERRTKQIRDIDKTNQMSKFRWSQSAEEMAGTRSFLCLEAGALYGLRRTKKGSAGRYEYFLGGLPVVDLASMNSMSPEAISTSLAHIAHILILTCHYLSIRLPAAITLPHRDYPRPTISNLSGSYKGAEAAFPAPSGTSTPTSDARDPDSAHVPRPRPLYVDKPLPQLAKEDSATFSYFVEGVTLLAYDIAWACSTQGVPIGDRTYFEDICNMGKNLYSLLISQQTNSGTSFPRSPAIKTPGTDNSTEEEVKWMGRFSHGTTYYFLGGADGTDFTKNFKLPSPMKLADKLKKKLLSEASVPDWEVLDDDAWKLEEDPNEAARGKSGDNKMAPGRESGGWMKVKNR